MIKFSYTLKWPVYNNFWYPWTLCWPFQMQNSPERIPSVFSFTVFSWLRSSVAVLIPYQPWFWRCSGDSVVALWPAHTVVACLSAFGTFLTCHLLTHVFLYALKPATKPARTMYRPEVLLLIIKNMTSKAQNINFSADRFLFLHDDIILPSLSSWVAIVLNLC